MIKVNELFSGIGAQRKAFDMLGIPHEVVNTVEIDKDAMLSYAAIHCELNDVNISDRNLREYILPERNKMAQYLIDLNIGYDFEKDKPYDWFKLTRSKSDKLEKYYIACILSKNLGDINKIDKLNYADFWTYSFPCTDISVAGKQKGINENTRSGTLYQVERLLKVAEQNNELPKYLMLENVKNLVGKKFKSQFNDWCNWLNELGYNTCWQVLNAKKLWHTTEQRKSICYKYQKRY